MTNLENYSGVEKQRYHSYPVTNLVRDETVIKLKKITRKCLINVRLFDEGIGTTEIKPETFSL